jgi:RNA polymerase sigma factor (sigma-70 family)
MSAFGVSPAFAGPSLRLPGWDAEGWRVSSQRATVESMSTSGAALDRPVEDELAAEESRLAAQAAGGDGAAFATLYERYEQRAYNLCLRITSSPEDAADATQDAFVNVMRRLPQLEGRELAFGSYLFTAARNASYDLIQKRKRAEPTDEIPEDAAPAGPAGGFDPGDPGDDPERSQLLEAQQDEIREANGRLPERQREALALRELESMSYDEIAEIMDMNRNSVAQLISRARVNLRDELRQTALASVAASSEDCERALPLIASAQDGELELGTQQDWLAEHLRACERCAVSVQAMEEAGASYRAWAPVAAAPWLFKETVAKAAEAVGADWSDVERPTSYEDPDATTELPGTGAGVSAGTGGLLGTVGTAAAAQLGEHRRRMAALAAALAAILLLGVLTALADDDSGVSGPGGTPVADEAPAAKPTKGKTSAAILKQRARKRAAARRKANSGDTGTIAILQPDGSVQIVERGGGSQGAGGGGGGQGDSGVVDGGLGVNPPPTSNPVPRPTPDPTPPSSDPTPPSSDPTPPQNPPSGRTCTDPRTGATVPC